MSESGTSMWERMALESRDADDEMSFIRVEPPFPSGVPGNELPVRDYDAPTYHAKYRTTTAIIVIDSDTGEIRIPDIQASEPGDFARFMDELVDPLDTNRVKFVGVLDADFIEMGKEMGIFPEHARSLYEVLDGFEEVNEVWDEHPRFDGKICNCLVGHWEVE